MEKLVIERVVEKFFKKKCLIERGNGEVFN